MSLKMVLNLARTTTGPILICAAQNWFFQTVYGWSYEENWGILKHGQNAYYLQMVATDLGLTLDEAKYLFDETITRAEMIARLEAKCNVSNGP